MFRVGRKVIATVELVGGGLGILALVVWPVGTPPARLLAGVLFALSAAAGLLLWRGRRAGVWLSVAVQLPQLLKVFDAELAYNVSLGLDVAAYRLTYPDPAGGPRPLTGVHLHCQVGPLAVLNVPAPDGSPRGFGVSLTSAVALAVLLRRPPRTPDRPFTMLPEPNNLGLMRHPD